MLSLVLFAALALGVSFLCSLLEASLLSMPRSHVELLVRHGSPAGLAMKHLKDNIDRPLAAILTLNTIAHTVGAAGVGAQAAVLFGDAAVGIASGVMTFAILVFSEIIPKTLGAVHTKSLTGFTANLTRGMIALCYPIILVLEWTNRLLAFERHGTRMTRMELLATIRLGQEAGSLADREYRIIANLMGLSETRISDILTPRTVMFALPAQQTIREALSEHISLHFARIPLFKDSPDEIVGYVPRHEIHRAAVEGVDHQPLSSLAKPIFALPEQATVSAALEQFLAESEHLAIVVDEFGGVEGLVTLEDVIETLLGQQIVDETDPVPDMRAEAKRRAEDKRKPH